MDAEVLSFSSPEMTGSAKYLTIYTFTWSVLRLLSIIHLNWLLCLQRNQSGRLLVSISTVLCTAIDDDDDDPALVGCLWSPRWSLLSSLQATMASKPSPGILHACVVTLREVKRRGNYVAYLRRLSWWYKILCLSSVCVYACAVGGRFNILVCWATSGEKTGIHLLVWLCLRTS